MIHWRHIDEFIEPNWVNVSPETAPTLFWLGREGCVLGYIRDGELFDHKWLYICDANKVTHFSQINGPESNVVELDVFRPDSTQ